ncbi:MAG: hypothetical protein EPN45_01420 [Rhizobiaceae bacterium]|nr:MAG: hypothetical protein EPN45_01420 [Rhizobiaceae bacterium]
MIGHLVAGSGGNICSVIADGTYDGEPTYAAIRAVRPLRSPPKSSSLQRNHRSPTRANHTAVAGENAMQPRSPDADE